MKSVLVNSFFNSGKQVAAIIVAFVVSPIIVHSLGDEQYGLWSLIVSITGYYSFLELGVAGAVVKFVSHFTAQHDLDRAKGIFTTASLFFAAVGAVVFLSSIAVAYYFDSWFEVPAESSPDIFFIVVALGASTALSLVFSAVTASLFALQEIPALSTVTVVTNVLKNVLLVVFLYQGYGLMMMAVVTLATSLLRLLVLQLILALRHSFLKVEVSKFDTGMLKTVFTYGVYGFMIFVASKLLFYSSSVIIGKMVGISEVTYYAIPASLLIYVEAVIWSMLQVLIPVISGYDATGNVAGNQRLYVLGTRYSLAVSLPVMVTLFAVGDVFIANWMGEEYAAKGAFVLQVLVIGYLFQISRFVAEIILKGTNRHNVLALILLAQAVVGIVAGVLLAPRYGINGVALGTTIPLVVSSLVLVPIYTCKVLGISPLRFFRDGPAVPAILTGLFALVHWLIAPRVETYLDIVFYATMATTFFGLASWFLVLEEDHRETLVGQLRRLSWWRKSD